MPELAACHLIYVTSTVCIVFLYMLVANKVLSLYYSVLLVLALVFGLYVPIKTFLLIVSIVKT